MAGQTPAYRTTVRAELIQLVLQPVSDQIHQVVHYCVLVEATGLTRDGDPQERVCGAGESKAGRWAGETEL